MEAALWLTRSYLRLDNILEITKENWQNHVYECSVSLYHVKNCNYHMPFFDFWPLESSEPQEHLFTQAIGSFFGDDNKDSLFRILKPCLTVMMVKMCKKHEPSEINRKKRDKVAWIQQIPTTKKIVNQQDYINKIFIFAFYQ